MEIEPRSGSPRARSAQTLTQTTASDAPYYVKALAIGIPAILLGIQLSGWIFFMPVIKNGHFDFRQLYTAGYMVRSGYAHELYTYDTEKKFQDKLISPEQIALPFNHLAYEALLFAPFSFLSYRRAYAAFTILNLLFLGLCFRLLRPRMGNLAAVWQWLPTAMFITFLPIAAALMQGQDSILLLLLLASAWIALDQSTEWTAGLLTGLGLFKFQIVLPIAFVFLIWRRWRFLSGFTVAALTVGTISFWLAGTSQAPVYVRSLVSMSVALSSQGDQFRYGISPVSMANLRGLSFGLLQTHLTASCIQAVSILSSVVVLLGVAAFHTRPCSNISHWLADGYLLAITASSLASYHMLMHDLSVLLIPATLLLNRSVIAEARRGSDGRLLSGAAGLVFIAPMSMAFVPAHFYLASLAILAFLLVSIKMLATPPATPTATAV